MFMVTAATIMVIIFARIFSELYQDNLSEKKKIIAEDYGYSLQNEFILAAEAKDGYSRKFLIPEKLEGFSFAISITGTTMILNFTEDIFAYPIPQINGLIKKGINTLSTNNSTICLNC